MSVVAATKAPVQKLKKASAVLLLVGVTAFVVGLLAMFITVQVSGGTASTPGVTIALALSVLAFFGGLATLLASLAVRVIAAVRE